MKVRVNNKKVLIVMFIMLLLILAVGYAVFSEILTIQGTANAKGTFDLEFQNAEIVKNIGASKEKTTAEISADKNTLMVNVVDLSYPGAGVEFSVDIVNVGTIPAEVQSVTPNNVTGSDKIKITGLEEIQVGHPKLEVGDKCNIHFTVEWPIDSGEIAENESNISFGLQIEYAQSIGVVIPDHTVLEGITAVYGKTLADIQLPEGFRFQDPLDTPIETAGTHTFKVIYTAANGKELRDIEVSIEIEKANPDYTLPEGLTATYGQTLGDIQLPEGFKFQDSLETKIGSEGKDIYKATYTPTDTNNYNIVTDIEIKIEVIYQTLASQIRPSDYGKSVNYTATVKNNNTNTTQEVSNWKLLYKDKNKIYIILDDFLPVELVPEKTGLLTTQTYSVYSNTSAEVLLNGLTTTSYWSEFANGVEGATAIGSPKYEIFVKSYNEKNGKSIETDPTKGTRNSIDREDSLYIPHQSMSYMGVKGYLLCDIYPTRNTLLWFVENWDRIDEFLLFL